MPKKFAVHYHGTTADRVPSIADVEVQPIGRIKTRLVGAWTTEIREDSIEHAIKRGEQRGGLEPVILEYHLPHEWVENHDDREVVEREGYGSSVHCFDAPLPNEHFERHIYPQRDTA